MLRHGVSYFLRHFSLNRNHVRITLPTMAKRYLQFLELLGITADEVRILLFRPIPGTLGSSDMEALKARWVKWTGLPEEQLEVLGAGNWGKGIIGSIGVQVVGRSPGQILTKTGVPAALYGFRYAIYLKRGSRLA